MKNKIIIGIVSIVLALPVLLYTINFGVGFWQDQDEWANLGSYVGGIYTPILALLTLIVLCVQIYLQVIQHRQNLVTIQETQLTEYLNELNSELDKLFDENITYRQLLLELLNEKNQTDIEAMDLSIFFTLNQANHKFYSMWSGALSCLAYIKTCSNIEGLQSTHYPIQKNKIIAYMSPSVCSSLDKFHYCMQLVLREISGDNIKIAVQDYEFWANKAQA
ncbi:hypothetical protein ACFOEW_15645 [Alteromonas oceani]|uniref:Phage abortive infection protein n=1 Tax=Alteromonas oceani TaxID=2071609 RepID=A0ABV7K1I5_9ALTE|nr:hypothetical protein [Alteromonas oceani]